MKKIIALVFSLFVVTSVQAANDLFALKLYSTGSSPIAYDYRVHYSNHGGESIWQTIAAGKSIEVKYPHGSIASVEIKTSGNTNYGILQTCHPVLPVGTQGTTDLKLGPYWYVLGNLQHSLKPLRRDGLTLYLSSQGPHYFDIAGTFTVLDCWMS